MPEPVVARRKPFLVEIQAGKTYLWCACGRSQRQPFCDGSHRGTGFQPARFVAEQDREAVLCGCKHTRNAPFCDGSHNNLSDTYEEAGEDEIRASASITLTPRSAGDHGKAVLDGGCYVLTVSPAQLPESGSLRLTPVIDQSGGAKFLSQFYAEVERGTTGIMQFPGREAVLFIADGAGLVSISGRDFPLRPETGVHVRPDEGFAISNRDAPPLKLLITVCPKIDGPQWLDVMPEVFDESIPRRVGAYDPARREPMADRFYQVLIGADSGSNEVTEFIGEIPRSRAAAHRHLYEEAIMILSGEGYLWTEHARAQVRPGDIIFLPRKQLHSLECTSPQGMRLMGVFYPAGSPAVNY